MRIRTGTGYLYYFLIGIRIEHTWTREAIKWHRQRKCHGSHQRQDVANKHLARAPHIQQSILCIRYKYVSYEEGVYYAFIKSESETIALAKDLDKSTMLSWVDVFHFHGNTSKGVACGKSNSKAQQIPSSPKHFLIPMQLQGVSCHRASLSPEPLRP